MNTDKKTLELVKNIYFYELQKEKSNPPIIGKQSWTCKLLHRKWKNIIETPIDKTIYCTLCGSIVKIEKKDE